MSLLSSARKSSLLRLVTSSAIDMSQANTMMVLNSDKEESPYCFNVVVDRQAAATNVGECGKPSGSFESDDREQQTAERKGMRVQALFHSNSLTAPFHLLDENLIDVTRVSVISTYLLRTPTKVRMEVEGIPYVSTGTGIPQEVKNMRDPNFSPVDKRNRI